jgi:hypothetical protein
MLKIQLNKPFKKQIMKKYFAEMAHLNNPKNKAEEAVQSYAKGVNHTLIHGDENLQVFIKQFQNRVDEINHEFPRCKDISTEYRNYTDYGSMWVSACDVARIDFSEVKHEFPKPGRDWGRDLMGDMKADAE